MIVVFLREAALAAAALSAATFSAVALSRAILSAAALSGAAFSAAVPTQIASFVWTKPPDKPLASKGTLIESEYFPLSAVAGI